MGRCSILKKIVLKGVLLSDLVLSVPMISSINYKLSQHSIVERLQTAEDTHSTNCKTCWFP